MRLLPVGTVLNERYRIDAVLGQGGFGCVYLASHLELSRPVAIKEMGLHVDIAQRDAAYRQFRHEAQILHALSHPLLPRVHDFFVSDGSWYLVMDYVRGRSLHKLLELEEEPLEESQVVQWALSLCDVMHYLHSHDPQVVFRDLKPSNIMLDVNGEIRLVDFGISKILDAQGQGRTQTFARQSGSPGYAAPEQYGATTDARSDIYSLGATLYTLLTRVTPPESVMVAAGVMPLTPLAEVRPGLTPGLVSAIAAMMQLQAAQRPQSMLQVKALLQEVQGDPAPSSLQLKTPVAPALPVPSADAGFAAPATKLLSPRAPRRQPSSPGVWLGALGVVVVGLSIALFVLWPKPASLATAPSELTEMAELQVLSSPPGANVYLNGTWRGKTPLTLPKLVPVTYEIRVEAPGFTPVRKVLELQNGDTRTLDVPLSVASYRVTFQATPPGASLTVDQADDGPIGDQGLHLDLPAGPHQLTLSKSGYNTLRRAFTLMDGGGPLRLDLSLVAQHPPQRVQGATRVTKGTPEPTPVAHHTVVLAAPNPTASDTTPPTREQAIVPGERMGDTVLKTALARPVLVASAYGEGNVVRLDSSLLAYVGERHVVWALLAYPGPYRYDDVAFGTTSSQVIGALGQPSENTERLLIYVERGVAFALRARRVAAIAVFPRGIRLQSVERFVTRATALQDRGTL